MWVALGVYNLPWSIALVYSKFSQIESTRDQQFVCKLTCMQASFVSLYNYDARLWHDNSPSHLIRKFGEICDHYRLAAINLSCFNTRISRRANTHAHTHTHTYTCTRTRTQGSYGIVRKAMSMDDDVTYVSAILELFGSDTCMHKMHVHTCTKSFYMCLDHRMEICLKFTFLTGNSCKGR